MADTPSPQGISAIRPSTDARGWRRSRMGQFVELYIRCYNLVALDLFSQSDPQVRLFSRNGDEAWVECGRTETIDDCANPNFRKTFVVPSQPNLKLKMIVIDIDSAKDAIENHDYIGEFECQLKDITNQTQYTHVLRFKGTAAHRGSISIIDYPIDQDSLRSYELQKILQKMRFSVKQTKKVTIAGRKFRFACTGTFLVHWLVSHVLKVKGQEAEAIEVCQQLLTIGYITGEDAETFTKSDTEMYGLNPYFLIPTLAQDVSATHTLMAQVSQGPATPATAGAASSGLASDDQIFNTVLAKISTEDFVSTSTIKFAEQVGDNPTVVAGTPEAIIDRIVYPRFSDTLLRASFLLTYRLFMEPSAFLGHLIARFKDPSPITSALLPASKIVISESQRIVLVRIIGVIKVWLKSCYERDWAGNEALLTTFHEFVDVYLPSVRHSEWGTALLAALTLAQTNSMESKEAKASDLTGDSLPPTTLRSILSVPSLDFAKQLAVYHHELSCTIKETEFFGQKWMKKNKRDDDMAPNIINVIDRFNILSQFVGETIVLEADLAQRAELLSHFIKIASDSLDVGDYTGAMGVFSGLNLAYVARLKKTWAIALNKRHIADKHKVLTKRLSSQKNFIEMRNELAAHPGPCTPYMGTFLSDLVYIEDGNPSTTEEGLINMRKYIMIARTISNIQRFQHIPYTFEFDPSIQSFIRHLAPTLSDDDAYALSLKVEPRYRPPPDINVMADEAANTKADVLDLLARANEAEAAVAQLNVTNERLTIEVYELRATVAQLVDLTSKQQSQITNLLSIVTGEGGGGGGGGGGGANESGRPKRRLATATSDDLARANISLRTTTTASVPTTTTTTGSNSNNATNGGKAAAVSDSDDDDDDDDDDEDTDGLLDEIPGEFDESDEIFNVAREESDGPHEDDGDDDDDDDDDDEDDNNKSKSGGGERKAGSGGSPSNRTVAEVAVASGRREEKSRSITPAALTPLAPSARKASLMTGYLWKLGDFRKGWKKRYFALAPNLLMYYDDPSSGRPTNVVPLDGCYVMPAVNVGRCLAFQVYHPVRRTFFLCADSYIQQKAWMSAISNEIPGGGVADQDMLESQGGVFVVVGKKGKKGGRDRSMTEASIQKNYNEMPAIMVTHPANASFLTKCGGATKNWKRRYFVCEFSVLMYYNKETDEKPLAVIPLTKDHSVRAATADEVGGREFGFLLVGPDRTFQLVADTAEVLSEWLATLKDQIPE